MNDTITTSPQAMRANMVDRIVAGGWARSGRVAEAMRSWLEDSDSPAA